jgi:PAS domain S-box-containing protein
MLGEDIDLNEIFADYFINEFEDPLNAYTNSMANYNGAAAAVALAQKQQQIEIKMEMNNAFSQQNYSILPTGGIKTSFHSAANAQQQHNQNDESNSSLAPVPKKLKAEEQQFSGSGVVTAFHQTAIPQQGDQIIGKRSISGRLGISIAGSNLGVSMQQQQNLSQNQNCSYTTQVTSTPQQLPHAGGIPLPVGVGIRLGGIGGVAPSTAQAAPRGAHYTMWSGVASNSTGAGAMSEHAIAERRQRNREHAKRSRVRKKFMLESMQEQVRALQKENLELRMLIQEKIPTHAQTIISECCSKNSLFSDLTNLEGDEGETLKPTSLERADLTLIESLTSGQQNFVLSDPRLPDNPIVYASPGFYVLTGYTQAQVLGRNCRFLQGPGTDPRSVDIIRKAVASGSDATTCILNYKADGTPFWNQFFVAALRDADNCIVNYVSGFMIMLNHLIFCLLTE